MADRLAIVKFGGGLIAPKDEQHVINYDILNKLSKQVAQFDGKIIVIHGAGSFGHTYALNYNLQKGFSNPSQYEGLIKTHQSMERLNYEVVESLIEAGRKAISIQTSAITITENKRIKTMFLEPIQHAIDQGLTPVLYGDVVFDLSMRFCILSGDQILAYLSEKFNPEIAVFAADVDGVFDANPKENPNAKLISKILKDSAEETIKGLKKTKDATGGIVTKVIEAAQIRNRTKFIIGNGKKDGWLIAALKGENVRGTYIY